MTVLKGRDISQKRYRGVGFIKSRKSNKKIVGMAKDMAEESRKYNIDLQGVLVDDSSGRDVDRQEIDTLVSLMEKGYIEVIVVCSIFDITKDVDDLMHFIDIAHRNKVMLFSVG